MGSGTIRKGIRAARARGMEIISKPRGNLYRIISDRPGITFGGIMEVANIGNGTASYHLHRLERRGLIISRASGRCRMFWIANFKGLKRFNQLPAVSRRIMAMLHEREECLTVGSIAAGLGMSHQRVSYNLRTLELGGMVKRVRRGRETLCFPVAKMNER